MYWISDYEKQYMNALSDIYHNGFSDGVNERTGIATKRLPNVVFRIDVEKEFPILKSKFVAGITALREVEWIWKKQSNNIHDLNAHIWDEWADKNGSIGKAYGYQMARPVTIKLPDGSYRYYPDQAHYVRDYLKEFPNGRWAVSTLWNPSEMKDMALVPCVHTHTWNLDGGRLNLLLDQRSGDMPYGVPFDTTQYAEIMIQLARDLGVKPGIMTHVIADAHIYDNQMEGVATQLERWEHMMMVYDANGGDVPGFDYQYAARIIEVLCAIPKFYVDTDETDFFKISDKDCYIAGYSKTAGNMGPIDFGKVAK